MYSIIKLLSLIYEKECNNKQEDRKMNLKEKSLITIMSLAGIIIFYSSFKDVNNTLLIGSSIFIIIIIIIGLNECSHKKSLMNCEHNKIIYYKSLNLLKNKMHTDFNVYSKDKILILIDECDNVINEINSKNSILKSFARLWKPIFAPIVAFISGLIINEHKFFKDLDSQTLILVLFRLAIVISFILGMLWLADYLSLIIFKKEKQRVIRLKYALKDLYLKNFV